MTQPTAAARESQADPAAHEGPDVRSAVVTGVTTALWYAVPDVVGPRWGRALAKTAVAVGGFGLGLAVTAEGRAAREGLRAVGDTDEPDDGPGGLDDELHDDLDAGSGTGTDEPDDLAARVDPRVAVVAVTVGLGAGAALAVAGEKLTYRLGERWRARGRSLPHTRVGLAAGALAAGLTLLEPWLVGGRPDRSPSD